MSDWPTLPGDPDLPPGVSNRDIDRAAGAFEDECEVCEDLEEYTGYPMSEDVERRCEAHVRWEQGPDNRWFDSNREGGRG